MPRRFALALVLLAAHATLATAQTWPSKTIHAIVPLGAGSATDVIPRIIFDQLAPLLGQTIVVENRPGAGTTTGTNLVAKAEPDGYTILATSSAYTVAPAIQANLGYDPLNDLVAIATFVDLPNVMIISPDRGFKTVQEYVAAARAKPGSATFASVGIGSGTHFSSEKFRLAANFQALHIPFRGGPEALTEVIAGRVDFYFCPINTALPYIREGKLLALALGARTRSSLLPDVPTTLEAGYPDSTYDVWLGMLAPAKTPADIVAKLNAENTKAMQTATVREKFAKTGLTPLITSPADFAARIKAEIADNMAIAKKLDLKVN